MKTKTLYNLNDFNDWLADHLVLNEMHGVLEPSPTSYPCKVHWYSEDPGLEFACCKLHYHFTYEIMNKDVNIQDILDWFENTDFEMEYLDGDGQFDKELFIDDFKNKFV